MRVVNELNGYMPLKVELLPEGTYCPPGTPFGQIRNTVEGFGDLVTWLEPIFMHVHFPSTTTTQALRIRRYLEQKQRQYGYDDSFLWRAHSFGFRGHRSLEDAYWAATSWSMFLKGTDDIHVVPHISDDAVVGSISALAHKVTQQFDDEFEGFKYSIDKTAEAGKGIVALVIDTYDPYRVINDYLYPLATYARSKGIHIVLRPDSGDTWDQVVAAYRVVHRNKFDNVSAIIGEDMSYENMIKADQFFEEKNVPLNFVSYGIGGGFYNYANRDTLGFAMKTAFSNGSTRMKFSSVPIKRSIPGIVTPYYDEHGDLRVRFERDNIPMDSAYEVVYYHDENFDEPVYKEYNEKHWAEVRDRALKQDMSQHIIYLDEEIRDEIDKFRAHYGISI
ncbi:nicotinate phosphoribosyltransferase [Bacillus stercoris]|nr:nicotinate phosphoribosyltransferase [Bacillus stercoris]